MNLIEVALKLMKEPPDPAYHLLMRHLSPTQRRTFKRAKYFYVYGNHSGDRYLIDGEIRRVRDNHEFCLVVMDEEGEGLPYCDVLLAKKLLIECNERLFLETANDLMRGE